MNTGDIKEALHRIRELLGNPAAVDEICGRGGRHQTAPTSCDYSSGANFDVNRAFRDYLTKSYVIPKLSKLSGTSVNRASRYFPTPGNAPDPGLTSLAFPNAPRAHKRVFF